MKSLPRQLAWRSIPQREVAAELHSINFINFFSLLPSLCFIHYFSSCSINFIHQNKFPFILFHSVDFTLFDLNCGLFVWLGLSSLCGAWAACAPPIIHKRQQAQTTLHPSNRAALLHSNSIIEFDGPAAFTLIKRKLIDFERKNGLVWRSRCWLLN